MARPPLVSVVVPCYNQAHFLGAALKSIAAQTYSAIQPIVVDDGSNDGSAEVAITHGAQVLRQSNQGVGAARNAGLASAAGDFIVFLDADDELLPDSIRSGVDILTAHEDAPMLVRRCRSVDALGSPLPTHHPDVDRTDLYREWLGNNFVWTPGAAMFRRAAITAIGGFPIDVGPASDYAVYLRFARMDRVVFIPEEAVRYRHHAESMSKDPIKMLRATLEVLARERPHVPVRYRHDFRLGIRAWQQYFGDQLVDRIRTDVRKRGLRPSHAIALARLFRWCPSAFATHAARKASRLVARTGTPRSRGRGDRPERQPSRL